MQAIVDEAVTKSAPIANRQVGTITADIVRAAAPSGESPLGNLIADSQLAATTSAGAQIALMNPGGVRADLTFASSPAGEGDGVVTYGEAFTVQPFSNILQTLTYTGAQIDAVLEQQWLDGGPTRILQPSATLHYTQTLANPIGDRDLRHHDRRRRGRPGRDLPGDGEQLPGRRWGQLHRPHPGHGRHRWADRPGRVHRVPDGQLAGLAAGDRPDHGRLTA